MSLGLFRPFVPSHTDLRLPCEETNDGIASRICAHGEATGNTLPVQAQNRHRGPLGHGVRNERPLQDRGACGKYAGSPRARHDALAFRGRSPRVTKSAMHRLVFVVLNHDSSPAAQPPFPWFRLTLHADLELAGADEVRQD